MWMNNVLEAETARFVVSSAILIKGFAINVGEGVEDFH